MNNYQISKEINLFGKIQLKDDDVKDSFFNVHYVFIPEKPMIIKINNINKDVNVMEIIFSESFFPNNNKEFVYKIKGYLTLVTGEQDLQNVLIKANEIREYKYTKGNIFNWLSETSGSFRGQPVQNWAHVLAGIIIFTNLIWYLISKIKKSKRKNDV
ncbi:hypothetical protein [Breznakiella homolactica]|uniref:Uncharacterized protein n=1 Tax=Breznakiella homolactica TaxID=2798577 RepID=A0A7T7XQ01_9SPIR|nr:hypothetical protein [Breznakiella homolactica]QQO10394.1 hypothetical protein JFL75_05600 [Breznakiella homolactica]